MYGHDNEDWPSIGHLNLREGIGNYIYHKCVYVECSYRVFLPIKYNNFI